MGARGRGGRLFGGVPSGLVGRHFDLVLMRNGFPVATKLVWKLLTRKYRAHARSRQFVRWLLTAGYQEQPKHPANAAHLHLNLAGKYRGSGVGARLWETFEQRLCTAGVERCYGSFFSHPQRRPESAYARYGFSVFDRRRTTIFSPEVREVEVVCVCKTLRNDDGV